MGSLAGYKAFSSLPVYLPHYDGPGRVYASRLEIGLHFHERLSCARVEVATDGAMLHHQSAKDKRLALVSR